jgi:hypothetical protein
LAHSGTDATHNPRAAADFADDYTNVSDNFNGSYERLHPGTIIVKNSKYAEEKEGRLTSSNHVVIFIGYASPEGEETPRPCIVESTTYRGVSGVQIAHKERIDDIAAYQYARDPFQ